MMNTSTQHFNFQQSKLERVDIQDLFFCHKSPVEVFIYSDHYEKVKKQNDKLDKNFFLELIKKRQSSIYVYESEIYRIYDQVFSEVTILARGAAKESYLEFSKKITHYLFTQQKHLLIKPLEDKLINNQMTTFKIWLSFIKKLNVRQFQEVIKNIFVSPYLIQYKKNIVSATFLYRLLSSENLFSENYCLNLANSCLFSEIGASLFSQANQRDYDKIKERVYKYSGLILTLKTTLPPQNIKLIESGAALSSQNFNDVVWGQETYYFAASYYLCEKVFKAREINLKDDLATLKSQLPQEYNSEFKNIVSRAVEFFGKTKLPDQMTR